MSKNFTYFGGPKDKVTARADEASFPEEHEGGEYRWTGSHGLGSAAPDGPLPEATKGTATWFPTAGQ